jgi:hypothetical protein
VGVRSGGLPHFSSWFTLAGWVAPDRSNCGEPSSVVVLISLPRDQNAQTMQVQVPREPRAPTYSQGYSIDPSIITTLSSRLSQSILLHCILYGCLLPSLLLHLRCEHERESTLECWELKDDPYLTQTALQYTLHSFDSQYFDIDIWITFYSTRRPSSRDITTITTLHSLNTTILDSSQCPPLALTEMEIP